MNIIDTIRKFKTFFKKDTLIDDLTITIDELNKIILAYVEAEKVFKNNKFKSEIAVSLSTDYFRGIDTRSRGSFITDIRERLENVLLNVISVEKLASDLLEVDIVKDGLTAKKTNYIQVASYAFFIAKYSLELLNYIYILETKTNEEEIPGDLLNYKKEYIVKNMYEFSRLISTLSQPNDKFLEYINSVPDVVINETTHSALNGVYGDGKLNMFSYQVKSGFTGNPIYTIRLLVAEWEANRYKKTKDTLQLLQLRKLNYEFSLENNPSPHLEKQIEVISERIEGLENTLRRMEED